MTKLGLPRSAVAGELMHEHDRNAGPDLLDRKSTRLNSSHLGISYAVFCLKKKRKLQCLSLVLSGCDQLRLTDKRNEPGVILGGESLQHCLEVTRQSFQHIDHPQPQHTRMS